MTRIRHTLLLAGSAQAPGVHGIAVGKKARHCQLAGKQLQAVANAHWCCSKLALVERLS